MRIVNVLNLLKLDKSSPECISDSDYEYLYTKDKPVIFVFHGYPNLISDLTINRNKKFDSILGYLEEGAITTPFDMRVKNKIDRFNICLEAVNYINDDFNKFELTRYCVKNLLLHSEYIKRFGKDMDIIDNWKWNN